MVTFQKLPERIKDVWKRLDAVQACPMTDEVVLVEEANYGELQDCLKQEQMLWRVKSRETWLTSSDLNTKYFHLSTRIRRRQNRMDMLKTDMDEWLFDSTQIGDHVIHFFTNLFTAGEGDFGDDLRELISPVVTPEDNAEFERIPTETEIFRTLCSIGGNKAPGPDGMTSLFYRSFWPIVKQAVVDTVQDFFRGRHLLKALNHSHIVLIPENSRSM